MSDDVTIPRDVARAVAERLRSDARHALGMVYRRSLNEWADLLDPKPPLREKVGARLAEALNTSPHSYTVTFVSDAVLAVVADDISRNAETVAQAVARLRGES